MEFLMSKPHRLVTGVLLVLLASGLVLLFRSVASENSNSQTPRPPRDAVADAQTAKEVPAERPEQKKTAHDLSDIFAPSKALPTTGALADQPEQGGMNGF